MVAGLAAAVKVNFAGVMEVLPPGMGDIVVSPFFIFTGAMIKEGAI